MSFELALNGALWYKNAADDVQTAGVLNLPSTGHYGIRRPARSLLPRRFELALNGALWYTMAPNKLILSLLGA